MGGFEIQHDTQVFRAACAQGLHGGSMGQQHMVHGARAGPHVAVPRSVVMWTSCPQACITPGFRLPARQGSPEKRRFLRCAIEHGKSGVDLSTV